MPPKRVQITGATSLITADFSGITTGESLYFGHPCGRCVRGGAFDPRQDAHELACAAAAVTPGRSLATAFS